MRALNKITNIVIYRCIFMKEIVNRKEGFELPKALRSIVVNHAHLVQLKFICLKILGFKLTGSIFDNLMR